MSDDDYSVQSTIFQQNTEQLLIGHIELSGFSIRLILSSSFVSFRFEQLYARMKRHFFGGGAATR